MQRICLASALCITVVLAAGRRHHIDPPPHVNDTALQQKFETIYSEAIWGTQGGGSGAGSGQETTQYARSILRLVVNNFGLRSMADVPCGSMHWMPVALRDLRTDVSGFQYLGVDIVRSVIERHHTNFRNDSGWMRFLTADFTTTPLPEDYDLIFCRDALQHLSFVTVISALELFSKSSARFLLVGSYMGQSRNTDIISGEYWDIDLLSWPFELTGYQTAYSEHTKDYLPEEPEKFMLLYAVDYLKTIDYQQMLQRATSSR